MNKEKLIKDYLDLKRKIYALELNLKHSNMVLEELTESLAPYIEAGAGEIYEGFIFDKKEVYSMSIKDSSLKFRKAYPELVKTQTAYQPNKPKIIKRLQEGEELKHIQISKKFKITTKSPEDIHEKINFN